MLADPAETGVACKRFFEHRPGVDVYAVTEGSDARLDTIGEILQCVPQDLVIVPTERIARHVGLLRVFKHLRGGGGGIRPIVEAYADRTHSAGFELGGSRSSGAMTRHVVHVAVAPLGKPTQQMSLVFGEFEMGDAERRETELDREGIEFASERMQVDRRHAASISTTVYCRRRG